MKRSRVLPSVMAGLCAAAAATGAAAQAQSGPGSNRPDAAPQPSNTDPESAGRIGEVVVTARKRTERLQNTPVAISAVTSAAIENKNIESVLDVARGLPNVTATSGSQGSSDADFFIRGVGQYDFIATNDPGVGIYIDGVYLARAVGALLDSGDVNRIEVLRGPQGTLFGRNTIGGAVSVVTKDPSFTKDSVAGEVSFGSRSLLNGEIDANYAIDDKNALGLAFISRYQDGQSVRVSDGARFGTIDRKAVRAVYLGQPADKLTVRVSVDYTHDDGSPDPIKNVGINLPVLRAATAGTPFPTSILSQVNGGDFYQTFQANAPVNKLDTGGASVTLTYDAGLMTVKSITAFRLISADATSNSSGTSYSIYNQDSTTAQNQVSQELQFISNPSPGRPFDWLGGLYFFRENVKQVQALCIASAPVPFGPCGNWDQHNKQITDSYAAYGEFYYHFTPQLTLTLGGRYTYDEKTLRTVQDFNFTQLGGPVMPIVPNAAVPGATGVGSNNWDDFTPKANLAYQATRNLLLYATYSEGFRSGGFNGRIAVPGPLKSYNPDTNDSGEIGLKSDFLDGRARVNLAAFYSKYKNIQLTVTDPVLEFYVANAAAAELKGVEAETTFLPFKGFELDFNFGYTDSEITEAAASLAPARVFKGNELPFTPHINFDIGAQYEFALPSGMGSVLSRMDYAYQSRFYFSPSDQPLERQPGYGLLNGRITWRDASRRYKVAVFSNNLANQKYYTFGEDATFNQGVAYAHVGRPREFGATLGVAF